MKTNKYTRRFEPHHTTCNIQTDENRIEISFERMYPTALGRISDSLEEMRLCAYTIKEETTIFMMQPDYGMFGDEDELKDILSELAAEVNYELTYTN